MKTGIEIIAAERARQTEAEGWSAAHDDEHTDGSLAVAAACYATQENQGLYERGKKLRELILEHWPWERRWWKAGALIAAEIDRLQRLGSNTGDNRSREAASG